MVSIDDLNDAIVFLRWGMQKRSEIKVSYYSYREIS